VRRGTFQKIDDPALGQRGRQFREYCVQGFRIPGNNAFRVGQGGVYGRAGQKAVPQHSRGKSRLQCVCLFVIKGKMGQAGIPLPHVYGQAVLLPCRPPGFLH